MRTDGPRCLAVLASRIRVEENLILTALERRGIPYERLDERTLTFHLDDPTPRYMAVLNRSISHTRGLYAVRMMEAAGVPAVNPSHVIEMCGDKLLTSLALVRAGIPTPRTAVALSPEAALGAIETIGYPVVVKPLCGSWGRLISKVNDLDAAEALMQHREMLHAPQHSIIYIQEYLDKPGRDIRTIVIDDEVVGAIYRYSLHWVTNTARGGDARPCPLTGELVDLSVGAARAVGGGALAVDILERPDGSLTVIEVNHTMEFHGMMSAIDVDIAGRLVDYVQKVARQ
jgi:[lysine-biosynthesis-protein LysW]--L-2-aminoadipate ligase